TTAGGVRGRCKGRREAGLKARRASGKVDHLESGKVGTSPMNVSFIARAGRFPITGRPQIETADIQSNSERAMIANRLYAAMRGPDEDRRKMASTFRRSARGEKGSR